MRNLYYGNEDSVRFRLRLKLVLAFLLLLVLGTAAQAQCPTPPGNPAVYGNASWIGYVYSGLDANNPPLNAHTPANYVGYFTQSEQFNYDAAAAAVPSANTCGSYADSFSVRFRMQRNFPAGYYSITIGGDDGVRLSTNGGASWAISDWNYHSYQTTTAVLYLSGIQDMVLETYDQGGQFHISFSYNACLGITSTAPASISATNTAICGGSSTTLTASGGTLGTSGTYQWGTGTVGSNILPDTTASITVNPLANTNYWVRRVDTGICALTTGAVSQLISVTPVATAPTSISGTGSICAGASAILTASGGAAATGSTYEWGTGSVVGTNPIAGTGASITVAPLSTTTYWVRRISANSCGSTTGATGTVTTTPPPGDQVSYGSGSWIGYVYASFVNGSAPVDAFTTPYRGYQTQTETFDQNLGAGSISGANICGAYADKFAVRYKMTKYMSGSFNFTVGGDDGYRLSIDGGATWLINNWVDHGYATTTSSVVNLNGNINLVLEYYENTGDSHVSFTYSTCGATAPTTLTADSVCYSSGTNIYVGGGSGNTYQWGTGTTIGSNVTADTGSSIYANPAVSTTYWVRRYDAICNYYTSALSITIYPVGTGPWGLTSSASPVCAGSSVTLTANPGTLPTGSSYQWGTGSTAGSNILGTSTVNTRTVTVMGTTTYWVRIINGGSCPAGSAQFVNVDINALSTAPTSITGDNGLCSVSGINLFANGGTPANGTQYQWGTGSVIGTNSSGLTAGNTLFVNPTVTTTYWVRRYDSACNNYTGGTTVVVTKGSTGPYNITAPWMVCAGTSVTLTADGTPGSGTYQWGFGTNGSNIISAATTNSITVMAPAVTTTYWVRILGTGTCGNSGYATYSLQVYTPSTGPTSISGTSVLCNGGGQNLTANGITFGNGNGQYQWGTGSIVGTTPITNSNTQTLWVQPTAATTYWVRAFDSTCGTYSAGVTFFQNVSSTAPTAVTGITTICSGTPTTLTASGGYASTGSVYEWGTGATAGLNPITGSTAAISVSPAATTTYWVRRYDGSPCNAATSAIFITVTVSTPSVAPTSITGAPATTCPNTAMTLTAAGGSGSITFQWGTGNVAGTSAISGSGISINVSPTTTTTYWVRRSDGTPCGYTAAAFVTVTIVAAPGDPSVFGTNQWNAYGYNGGDITLAATTYRGYYIQNTLSPNTQNMTANGWSNALSPSASAGWNGCAVNNDTHTFVYKRQGFPCGTYSLIMTNWDDQLQVFLNGTQIYTQAAWSNGNVSNLIGSYNLDASSQIEIRVRENTSNSSMAMTITKTDVASVAPTSVTGTTTSCSGTAITLTANAGTKGTNGLYQWGTGIVGTNILATTTGNTLSVSPLVTTTYWVRFIDTLCGTTTSGVSMTVSLTATVAGTISTPISVICRNSTPAAGIILSGQSGSVVKWQYASDAAFLTGITDIAVTSTTLTGSQIGPVPATRFYRAVIQSGSCLIAYTNVITIVVPAAITFNGIWSGTPTATTPVIINSNLSLNTNLTVCSCEVANNAVVTINNNASLIVVREVKVNAGSSFIIEDKGSLVQVEDDAADVGSVIVKRNTTPMRTYDYTYWSSPVVGNTLHNLSPNTLSDKYYSFNPAIGNWSSIAGGNAPMASGTGYIVRAPIGWGLTNGTSGVFNSQFSGVPNTGIINTPIIKSVSPYNLIGNPYPSAINIDLFITDPANLGVINGTIYLWTHNTPITTNGVYVYTTSDYAKYNLTGGVKTGLSAITGGTEPTGKIASGQGFFIEGKTGLANGTYSAKFSNSMRVANSNNQFFRMSQTDESTEMPAEQQLEKHRIWVNITNAAGAYDEALIGYIGGATNDKDPLFDGTTFPAGNAASLYSILGADKLSIQGRTLPFDNQDFVPMGYKVTVAGDFKISLEHFDGLFDNQNVFLLDKSDNTYHNLKLADYTFSTITGQFDSRFEIHYTESTLGIGDHISNENSVMVIKNNNHIEISSGSESMKSVTLYDVTGKKIYWESDINNNLFVSNELAIANQVIIVKIELENDIIVTKKVSF